MASLKERAIGYVPRQTKNIADLPEVSVDVTIYEDGIGTDNEDKEFQYNYIQINGEEFRVPNSVLAQVKDLIAAIPTMQRFQVKKSGEGLKTRYTVIPLV